MRGVVTTVEELAQLRVYAPAIFLSKEKKTTAAIAGSYASPFRGRGIDFSEVRTYQPGDDIRQMDWRVTARTGKPHTKLFIEERERPVFFAVDMRRSMRFGTRIAFKSVVAARVAALLAWAASGHGDRVGGSVLRDDAFRPCKVRGGKPGVGHLLRELATASSMQLSSNDPSISFSEFLTTVTRSLRPGSLLYVISDLTDFDTTDAYPIMSAARHCDVALIHIYDSFEMNVPPPGVYWVSDGSHHSAIDSRNKKLLSSVHEFEKRVELQRQFALRNGIRWLSISTHDDLVRSLQRQLRVETHNVVRGVENAS